jgi:hypothetical protein
MKILLAECQMTVALLKGNESETVTAQSGKACNGAQWVSYNEPSYGKHETSSSRFFYREVKSQQLPVLLLS